MVIMAGNRDEHGGYVSSIDLDPWRGYLDAFDRHLHEGEDNEVERAVIVETVLAGQGVERGSRGPNVRRR